MNKRYFLFIYTAPSTKVPHKLYYVDGHIWEDTKKNAYIFPDIKSVYDKQNELTGYETFIEEI